MVGNKEVKHGLKNICSHISSNVPEDWRSAVVVLLCKSKGERTECRNCRGIRKLSMV